MLYEVITALFNGESLSIWWFKSFWSVLYFDFVPELLEADVLGTDPLSYTFV